MQSEELKAQSELLAHLNAQLDELLPKAREIDGLLSKLPLADDLGELATVLCGIAESLKQAGETYNSDRFPSEANGLDEVAKHSSSIAESLNEAAQAWNSDNFPTAEELQESAAMAADLAASAAEGSGAE